MGRKVIYPDRPMGPTRRCKCGRLASQGTIFLRDDDYNYHKCECGLSNSTPRTLNLYVQQFKKLTHDILGVKVEAQDLTDHLKTTLKATDETILDAEVEFTIKGSSLDSLEAYLTSIHIEHCDTALEVLREGLDAEAIRVIEEHIEDHFDFQGYFNDLVDRADDLYDAWIDAQLDRKP